MSTRRQQKRTQAEALGLASGPATDAVAITPADGSDLAEPVRALFVGTGGNLTVDMVDGTASIVLKNVANGSVLPVAVKRVRATGTTATDIVGLF